jgi:hypothetical protein
VCRLAFQYSRVERRSLSGFGTRVSLCTSLYRFVLLRSVAIRVAIPPAGPPYHAHPHPLVAAAARGRRWRRRSRSGGGSRLAPRREPVTSAWREIMKYAALLLGAALLLAASPASAQVRTTRTGAVCPTGPGSATALSWVYPECYGGHVSTQQTATKRKPAARRR